LKELTELQRQIQEQEKDIGEKSRLLEEQREIIFAKAQQEAGVRNEINEKEDQKRKTWDKKERLAIHLEENHAKIKGWREKALGLQQDLSHKRHNLRETEQAVLLTQKQLQELTTDRSSLEEEINRLDQEIMGLENRLLAIRDLELDFTGYSEV
jgi:chromosome segregation ATPase